VLHVVRIPSKSLTRILNHKFSVPVLGGGGPSVSHKRNCEPTNESAKRVKISNEKPTDDPTENSVEDAVMPMEGILVNHKQDTIIESLVERKPEEYFHSQIADTKLHRERARFRRAEARKHVLEGRSEAAYPLYTVAISEDKLAEEGFAPILQAHKSSGCMFMVVNQYQLCLP